MSPLRDSRVCIQCVHLCAFFWDLARCSDCWARVILWGGEGGVACRSGVPTGALRLSDPRFRFSVFSSQFCSDVASFLRFTGHGASSVLRFLFLPLFVSVPLCGEWRGAGTLFHFGKHVLYGAIITQIRFDRLLLLICCTIYLVRKYSRISTVQIMQQLQQFPNSSPLSCLIVLLLIGPVLPLVGMVHAVCFVF